MKISEKEIKKIAELARLGLTKAEVGKFSKELSTILDYVEKLNQVKTEGVEPTSHVTGLENVLREDVVDQADCQKEIVDNAPDKKDGSIRVKSVFEK